MLINEDDFANGSKRANADKSMKAIGTLSLQPIATAHLALSVVLEFEASAFVCWKSHLATQFLNGARFAGGQIIKYMEPQEHDNLQSALRQIGRGFLVTDRTDLLQGRPDPMAALVDALYPEQEKDAQPWLCPTNLGYILADTPRPRHGARQGFPHAWGEPLAGLVQFKSLRAALHKETNPLPWSAHWLNEFTWVVQQKGA
jgi:CRISPR-associated protein Csy2